jgi:hypothetical protein
MSHVKIGNASPARIISRFKNRQKIILRRTANIFCSKQCQLEGSIKQNRIWLCFDYYQALCIDLLNNTTGCRTSKFSRKFKIGV